MAQLAPQVAPERAVSRAAHPAGRLDSRWCPGRVLSPCLRRCRCDRAGAASSMRRARGDWPRGAQFPTRPSARWLLHPRPHLHRYLAPRSTPPRLRSRRSCSRRSQSPSRLPLRRSPPPLPSLARSPALNPPDYRQGRKTTRERLVEQAVRLARSVRGLAFQQASAAARFSSALSSFPSSSSPLHASSSSKVQAPHVPLSACPHILSTNPNHFDSLIFPSLHCLTLSSCSFACRAGTCSGGPIHGQGLADGA